MLPLLLQRVVLVPDDFGIEDGFDGLIAQLQFGAMPLLSDVSPFFVIPQRLQSVEPRGGAASAVVRPLA
jgi:hypothetical protein